MRFSLLIGGVAAVSQSPLGKVVDKLRGLAEEIKSEGDAEAKSYDNYVELTTKTTWDAKKSIEFNESKEEEYAATVEEAGSKAAKLRAEIEKLGLEISENEKDSKENKASLKQTKIDFEASDRDFADTIGALDKAVGASKKPAMLQQMSEAYAEVLNAASINFDDKDRLASLMQQNEEGKEEAGEGAGDIGAVLPKLREQAHANRQAGQKKFLEGKNKSELLQLNFDNVGKTLARALAEKKGAYQEASGDAAEASKNLGTTRTQLASDRKLLKTTIANADTTKANFDLRQKGRAEEVKVVEEAIQILKGKAQAFLQTRTSDADDLRVRIASLLQDASGRLHSTGLAQLALRTRVGDESFSKVRGLIESMIKKLQDQSAKENAKHAYCTEQNAEGTAKKNQHSASVRKLSARVDKQSSTIAELTSDTKELSSDVQDLNESRAEATALRQKENSQFNESRKKGDEEIAMLQAAITTLSDYYGSQKSLMQAPLFDGGYESKAGAAGGIIGILESALSDATQGLAEADLSERNAQRAYDAAQQEGALILAEKTVAIKSKKAEVTNLQNLLQDTKSDREGATAALDATLDFLEKLRGQCTHKTVSFEERAQRRNDEIESLHDALVMLDRDSTSSFLQRRH